jgi:type II secretory pathway component PulF
VGVFVLLRGLDPNEGPLTIPVLVVVYTVFVVLLLRYGIVPLVVSIFTADSLMSVPITFDFSSWYIANSLVATLAVLAVAVYGFRCTVQGKRLFDFDS